MVLLEVRRVILNGINNWDFMSIIRLRGQQIKDSFEELTHCLAALCTFLPQRLEPKNEFFFFSIINLEYFSSEIQLLLSWSRIQISYNSQNFMEGFKSLKIYGWSLWSYSWSLEFSYLSFLYLNKIYLLKEDLPNWNFCFT